MAQWERMEEIYKGATSVGKTYDNVGGIPAQKPLQSDFDTDEDGIKYQKTGTVFSAAGRSDF